MSYFDSLVTQSYEESTTPRLANEGEYVAILVGKPVLWFSTKEDDEGEPKNSMSFRWTVLVSDDPNMNLESFAEKARVVKNTLWTYLGKVVPPAGMNEEQVKAAFESGQLPIQNPSPNLGYLAQTLGLERTGRFMIDEFQGHAFIVRAKHVPHWDEGKRAMNVPAIRIELSRAFVNEFNGERGPSVLIPAWYTDKAEAEDDETASGSGDKF